MMGIVKGNYPKVAENLRLVKILYFTQTLVDWLWSKEFYYLVT